MVLLRAVAAAAHGITIAVNDGDRPLVYANDAFLRMTGYSSEEVLGRNCRFLQGQDTDPGHTAAIRDALDAGRDITVVLRNYRRDGSPFWNEVSLSAVPESTGRISYFIGTQIDVTDRVDSDRELRRLAFTDPVTGISNREHMTSRFEAVAMNAAAGSGAVMVFADLDGFHRVNEDYDVETGNLILSKVAERLSRLTEPGDVLARLDADQFVLLRPAPVRQCNQLAQQIIDAVNHVLAEPVTTAGVTIQVRADCGTAVYPDDGETAATLTRAARRAMEHHRSSTDTRPTSRT